ncbi:MAG: F0F1 ATP synthase subunit A [Bryobacterales bacterium]|nr:F0F1 ATP synthase subunit A [Bryobacterales bacterium]
MHEHELWFTALLNRFLAGPANAALQLAGIHPHDPAKPWANYMAMEILVVLLFLAAAPLISRRFSVDKPGATQQVFEGIYIFLRDIAKDVVGHEYKKYFPWFATIFLFVLCMNLLGIIPSFESPTMFYQVPAGVAVATFVYYNVAGVRTNGVLGHLKHFMGPVAMIAPFMFLIEIISHCIRPVSLTIRLYANMLAGEQVTLSFIGLVPLLIPLAFMGLHMFVSFVQAFIFSMLSMVYVGEAVVHEEH